MTDRTTRLRSKIAWKVGLLLLLVVLGVVGIPLVTYERPILTEAADALVSDDLVTVTRGPWLTFTPTETSPYVGFIFYPGGRIAHEAYASLMRTLALEGYLAIVPDMPLNIAAFRPNVADKIIAAHPDIDQWVISGHSVGGAMAAQYTYKHSAAIDGLAIWASYPPDNADLSPLDIPVVLIYGGREIRVTDDAVAQRKHLLPPDTVYVRIEGGDHHQFGSYEIPSEDHLATVNRQVQHAQIIAATLELLSEISGTR